MKLVDVRESNQRRAAERGISRDRKRKVAAPRRNFRPVAGPGAWPGTKHHGARPVLTRPGSSCRARGAAAYRDRGQPRILPRVKSAGHEDDGGVRGCAVHLPQGEREGERRRGEVDGARRGNGDRWHSSLGCEHEIALGGHKAWSGIRPGQVAVADCSPSSIAIISLSLPAVDAASNPATAECGMVSVVFTLTG